MIYENMKHILLKFQISLTFFLLALAIFPVLTADGHIKQYDQYSVTSQISIEDESFSRISHLFGIETIHTEGKIKNLTDKSLRISYLIADDGRPWAGPQIEIISSSHPFAVNEDAFFKTFFVWTDKNSFVMNPYEEINYFIEFETPKRGLHLHTVFHTDDNKWKYSPGTAVGSSAWENNVSTLYLISFFLLPAIGFIGLLFLANYIEKKIKSSKRTKFNEHNFLESTKYEKSFQKSMFNASKADKAGLVILLIIIGGIISMIVTYLIFEGSVLDRGEENVNNPYLWIFALCAFIGSIFTIYGGFKLITYGLKKRKKEKMAEFVTAGIILSIVSGIFIIPQIFGKGELSFEIIWLDPTSRIFVIALSAFIITGIRKLIKNKKSEIIK